MATSLIPQFRLPYRCFTVLGSAAESARRLVFMILSAHDHSLDAYPTIHLAQGSNNVVGASPAKQFCSSSVSAPLRIPCFWSPFRKGIARSSPYNVGAWVAATCERPLFRGVWNTSGTCPIPPRTRCAPQQFTGVFNFSHPAILTERHTRDSFPRVVVAASPRHALTDYKAVGKTIRIETDDVTPVKDHHSIDFYITEYVAMRSRPSLFITL